MPEESRMSIGTGYAGGQGHVGKRASRGEAEGQSIQRAVSSILSVTRHRKNGKKSDVRHRKHHPPIERKATSRARPARVQPIITQSLIASKKNF